MASGSSIAPVMRYSRSNQSQNYAMRIGAWVTVYSEWGSQQPFLFAGCSIDLSNMQAGDTIVIRATKQLVSGGGYILHDQMSYSGAQPASAPAISIPLITASLYGIMIEMRQTAGVARNVFVETFDAFRLGLS